MLKAVQTVKIFKQKKQKENKQRTQKFKNQENIKMYFVLSLCKKKKKKLFALPRKYLIIKYLAWISNPRQQGLSLEPPFRKTARCMQCFVLSVIYFGF
jgi:hypothetical protein